MILLALFWGSHDIAKAIRIVFCCAVWVRSGSDVLANLSFRLTGISCTMNPPGRKENGVYYVVVGLPNTGCASLLVAEKSERKAEVPFVIGGYNWSV